MTIDIAAHVRIFDPAPPDDLVVKRTAAIENLGGRFTKPRAVPAIFQWANDLSLAVELNGPVSELLVTEIEAAIRKSAEAFVAEGQGLQITVCGLLGALNTLECASGGKGDATTQAALAIGLWSALSFQSPRPEARLESLRAELLQKARDFVLATATSSRDRKKVPEANIVEPNEFNAAGIAQSINAGLKATVDVLTANSAVDREELDLLWWVLGDWSELLGRRFSSGKGPAALVVAAGLEAGRMLRRMPADAHRHLVLRHVGEGNPLSLAELLNAVGDDRRHLTKQHLDEQTITACPAVFPLLAALQSGSATQSHVTIKRPLEEWAGRALLESAALHVTLHLPSIAV